MQEVDAYRSSVGELIKRVAAKSMTYRFYHWDWGESIGIEGIWQAYELTGQQRFADFVSFMVRSWISYSPDPWYPDHTGPGCVLVRLWQETGDRYFLGYAKRLADVLANLPGNPSGWRFHRPDLPDSATKIWVDSMQTDAPFLCSLGSATGEARWYDAAVALILGQIDALQDPKSGLFNHAYDDSSRRTNGVPWGRGNGWAFLGLVDTLKLLPRDHAGFSRILQSLHKLADSLEAWQDKETNIWRTVINHPDAYFETSASLMFVAAFLEAVQHGLLPENYAAIGTSAWLALSNGVSPDGQVTNVSARTPAADKPERYNTIPVGGHWPWGQGAYLLAAQSVWNISKNTKMT